MSNETVVVKSSGISFGGALFLIFLTLKLIGVITWSWWWVTAPLWLPLVIILSLLAIGFLFAAFMFVIAGFMDYYSKVKYKGRR